MKATTGPGIAPTSTGIVWLCLAAMVAPMAASITLISGLFIGLIMVATLLLTIPFRTRALRSWLPTEFHIPSLLLISAGWLTVFDLILSAWLPALRASYGVYLPVLTVATAAVAWRIPTQRPVLRTSQYAAIISGLYLLTLTLLGGLRELLSQGTLLSDAWMLTGAVIAPPALTTPSASYGFLLAGLPPTVFLLLGLVAAAIKAWRLNADQKNKSN